MAIRPTIPQMARAAFTPWIDGVEYKGPRHWRHFFPHGATGIDPRGASREAGEQLLDTAARAYAGEVENWGDL